MRFYLFPLAFLFCFNVVAQNKINFKNPPPFPKLFAEGYINTGARERDFAISPDGNEIYFTLQAPHGVFQTIVFIKKNSKGKWSKPEIVSFAGKFTDLEPAFSPDGKKLFFASNRPQKGTEVKDFDIWYVERTATGWSDPVNPGFPLNRSHDEFYPAVTTSGNIYFTAAYSSAERKEDIYVSKWENGKYQEPVALDTMVNSSNFEFNAYVSPDETLIIFSSYGREDDLGGGDLYISYKVENGKWVRSKHMTMLNSTKLDYCPFISPDKKMLFFTSERNALTSTYAERPSYQQLLKEFSGALNGGGNIYWVDFKAIAGALGIKQ